jgi:hypothetical protein
LKCTAKYSESIKYDVKVTSNIKNNKIEGATVRMTFGNSEDAASMCELTKLSKNQKISVYCYTKEVVIKNYEYTLMSDGKTPITKDDFIKTLKAQGFKC